METRQEVTLADVAEGIQRTDEMFSFLGDYDYCAEVSALRSEVATAAQMMLTIGCRLLRIKEHEPHGRFLGALDAIGLGNRSAQRFMSAALRFVSADTGKVKFPRLLQSSVSKIYELAMLDDEDLTALETGESVSDIQIDEIDKMTVRELRRKLRDGKADAKAMEGQLLNKNRKIDELERELSKNRQAYDEPALTGRSLELANQQNVWMAQITSDSLMLRTRIKIVMRKIEDAVGDDMANAACRMAWTQMAEMARSALFEMQRLVDEIYAKVPSFMAPEAPSSQFGGVLVATRDRTTMDGDDD